MVLSLRPLNNNLVRVQGRIMLKVSYRVSHSKVSNVIPGASLPPRQPRQLPWLIFETIMNYKLGRFEARKLLEYTVSFLQNRKNEYNSTNQKSS